MSEKEDVTTNEKKYELLLEHCYNDHINQDTRKTNVDTKTSYLLVIMVFIFGIVLDTNVLGKIIQANINSIGKAEIIFWLIIGLCYVANITLCLISTFFFINVLISKKYTKISTGLWNVKDAEDATYLEVVQGLIKNYSSATKSNAEINNKVLKRYKVGIILLVISIFFTIGIRIVISFF